MAGWFSGTLKSILGLVSSVGRLDIFTSNNRSDLVTENLSFEPRLYLHPCHQGHFVYGLIYLVMKWLWIRTGWCVQFCSLAYLKPFLANSHMGQKYFTVFAHFDKLIHISLSRCFATYLSILFIPSLWLSSQIISNCLWVSHLSVQSGKLNALLKFLHLGSTFLYCCHSLSHLQGSLLLHISTLFLPICRALYRRGGNKVWVTVKGVWATCSYILYLLYLSELRFSYTFFLWLQIMPNILQIMVLPIRSQFMIGSSGCINNWC